MPSVFVASTEFVDAAEAQARAIGFDAARVFVPHPIQDRTDDEEHTAASQEALDVVFAVMRGYGIEGADAVHAIRALRASLHGFVALEAAGGFGMPEDVDESFRRLVDGIDASLASRSSVR